MIEELWLIFRANKGPVGLLAGSTAVACLLASYRLAAVVLGGISLLLLGAGYAPSDHEEEERQGSWISRPWDR